MPRKYKPAMWEIDALFDSIGYSKIADCVGLVENQVEGYDNRNETQFSEEFGSLIQAAFLMAVVAHMEDHLKALCDALAEKRNLEVRVDDMRGGRGFSSCMLYFAKVLNIKLPPEELRQVGGIVAIRNAFVHGKTY